MKVETKMIVENYRIFEIFYHILPIEIPCSLTISAPLLSCYVYF
jgi:hypothetical protein